MVAPPSKKAKDLRILVGGVPVLDRSGLCSQYRGVETYPFWPMKKSPAAAGDDSSCQDWGGVIHRRLYPQSREWVETPLWRISPRQEVDGTVRASVMRGKRRHLGLTENHIAGGDLGEVWIISLWGWVPGAGDGAGLTYACNVYPMLLLHLLWTSSGVGYLWRAMNSPFRAGETDVGCYRRRSSGDVSAGRPLTPPLVTGRALNLWTCSTRKFTWDPDSEINPSCRLDISHISNWKSFSCSSCWWILKIIIKGKNDLATRGRDDNKTHRCNTLGEN